MKRQIVLSDELVPGLRRRQDCVSFFERKERGGVRVDLELEL